MKKKKELIAYFGIFLLFFLPLTTSVIYHQGGDVQISVDGTTSRTLNSGTSYFIGTHTYASVIAAMGQHDPNQVWVNVKDGEMTLLLALQSTNKLCPKTSKPTTYSSQPAGNNKAYHYATEIQLSATYSNKDLQTAINDGDFCGCTPGATRPITCDDTDCSYYPDFSQTCPSTGIWPVATCSLTGYKSRGTSCGDTKSCDGAGTCVDWYAGTTGCSGCPFGSDRAIGRNENICLSPSSRTGSLWSGRFRLDANSEWGNWGFRRHGKTWEATTCAYDCNCGASGCGSCPTEWQMKPY